MQFQERVLSRRQAEYDRMRAEREQCLSQVLQARREEREIKRKNLFNDLIEAIILLANSNKY